jgi:hypothetical protein
MANLLFRLVHLPSAVAHGVSYHLGWLKILADQVKQSSPPGVIEVEIAGAQLRLRGAVDGTVLSTVLRALRQSA